MDIDVKSLRLGCRFGLRVVLLVPKSFGLNRSTIYEAGFVAITDRLTSSFMGEPCGMINDRRVGL